MCSGGDTEDENRCVLVATLKMKTGVLCGDPEDKNKCFCGDTEDENRRVSVVTLKMKTGVFMW